MERAYVGIDFHRRRSVMVEVGERGDRLSVTRIDNTPTPARTPTNDPRWR